MNITKYSQRVYFKNNHEHVNEASSYSIKTINLKSKASNLNLVSNDFHDHLATVHFASDALVGIYELISDFKFRFLFRI